MCEIYDVSFLLTDRSKKYLILYDLSASNLSFDKKVKIIFNEDLVESKTKSAFKKLFKVCCNLCI